MRKTVRILAGEGRGNAADFSAVAVRFSARMGVKVKIVRMIAKSGPVAVRFSARMGVKVEDVAARAVNAKVAVRFSARMGVKDLIVDNDLDLAGVLQ